MKPQTSPFRLFCYTGPPAQVGKHGMLQTDHVVALTEQEARYVTAQPTSDFVDTGAVHDVYVKMTKEEALAAGLFTNATSAVERAEVEPSLPSTEPVNSEAGPAADETPVDSTEDTQTAQEGEGVPADEPAQETPAPADEDTAPVERDPAPTTAEPIAAPEVHSRRRRR